MGRTKITLLELGDRLRQGKDTAEIAAEFNMTRRGVQKKAQQLGYEISKSAVLHQSKIILSQQIDAQAQLLKINESANRLLDRLESQLDRDQEAVFVQLQGLVLEFKPHMGIYGGMVDAFLIVMREVLVLSINPATIDHIFKALAEIRKQLELIAKVAADWLEAKRLAAAHQVYIDAIAIESPECANRIRRGLGELQSSGLLFGFDGGT